MASTDSEINVLSDDREDSAPPSGSQNNQNASNTNLKVTDKEDQWLVDIRDALGLDLEKHDDMPVCIFRVPKSLVDVKPEAYTPQLIALGPYHHYHPQLYEMEPLKLAAVKRAFKPVFDLSKFEKLIQEIVEDQVAAKIYKCYRGLTTRNYCFIAWITAIDVLYLLELLNKFTNNAGESSHQSTQENQPEDYAIIRDVLKLENQIPIFVLKEILERTGNNLKLCDVLLKFCEHVSPIKLVWTTTRLPSDEVLQHRHLLDLLYQSITFKKNNADHQSHSNGQKDPTAQQSGDHSTKTEPVNHAPLTNLLKTLYQSIRFKKNNGDQSHPDGHKDHTSLQSEDHSTNTEPLNCGPLTNLLKKLSSLNIGKFMKGLCLLIIKVLEVLHVPMAYFKDKKVLIPSVSKLCRAGLKFCPTGGGTANVRFDSDTKTFYLPVVTLDRTSDVVMRNLVAYETMAMSKTKSLNFKRYMELMSAIIDTTEDVKLLKRAEVLSVQKKDADKEGLESKILTNAEIVEIFNEMTKTMESKDEVIDEAIRKANKCYYNTQKVKAYRLMKQNIYSSWKFLTFITSLLLLLMTALQTICGVYSCPSLFHTVKNT
ncbi:hypothetical protein PTKIN_Ptkin14bG0099000 [Pterospermum kingtungense]